MEQTVAERPISYIDHLEQIAKELGIKPLGKNEEAIYETTKQLRDEKNNRTIYPAVQEIPNVTSVWRPKTQRHETIEYVKSERFIKNGNEYKIEKETPKLLIENGQRIVTAKERSLYYYLEIVDYNETKPSRDSSVPALFKRVEKDKEINQALRDIQSKRMALDLVEKASDEQLRAAADVFKMPPQIQIDAIKVKLSEMAMVNPSYVIRSLNDEMGLLVLKVKEAHERHIIEVEDNGWKICETGKTFVKIDAERIVNPEDAYKEIAYWMKTDKAGGRTLGQISRLIEESKK